MREGELILVRARQRTSSMDRLRDERMLRSLRAPSRTTSTSLEGSTTMDPLCCVFEGAVPRTRS